MCNYHAQLVQKVLFGHVAHEVAAGQIRHLQRECKNGQSCNSGQCSHPDPTAEKAIKRVMKRRRY